jgi:hypothetical protein
MNTIKMKIVGYDEPSHSLLVAFASDTTRFKDPEKYTAYAYQPINMWPGVTDVEEIKKRIAQAGIYLAQQQTEQEAFVADQARVDALRNLVGNEFEYQIDELIIPEPQQEVVFIDGTVSDEPEVI